jgi:methylenetetrahydrofolate dehydrogenase (NADP+)/methenyltetrahydrofolate cyclohydrolase
MTYKLLEGKRVSEQVKNEVKNQVETLVKTEGIRPGLAFILVGDDPASQVYVRSKSKSCQDVGILSEELKLPANTSEDILLNHIHKFNSRKDIHGILVQHPLPSHIEESLIYESILPEKDVDGFHPFNVGRLLLGDPWFVPCTPLGVLELLRRYHIETSGAHVVVVGRSNIVGKPAAALFMQKSLEVNSTVTICHSGTVKLERHTRSANILIAAIGKPKFINADMISEGVIVVDVGINRIHDPQSERGYRLVGDVDFDSVSEKASAITPVPGGIGLMTVAMLLSNTLRAAKMTVQKTVQTKKPEE